jgi:ABC-type lipoprotein release transport system permease subunit
MGAIAMLTRSELRRRWRSVVVLTLLVGFAGAVVLALAAGARRTDSAVSRFESESRAADLEITAGPATDAELEEFARTPGVAAIGRLRQLTMVVDDGQFLATGAQVDDQFGDAVDRPRVVEGRLAHLDDPTEITIGESLAEQLGKRVGDTLHFRTYSPADIEALVRGEDAPPAGPKVTFRIVGIVRRPLDLGGRAAMGGVLVPTTAFYEQTRDTIGSFAGWILRVRTEHGESDIAAVSAAARRLFGRQDAFNVATVVVEGATAQHAIDVTVIALLIAAAVAALAGLVGIGIALSREISLADGDQPTLWALGLGPRARAVSAAAVGIPVALGGALLAVVGAIAASPLFPIGIARKAEPSLGVDLDAFVLGVGFVAIAVVLLVMAFVDGARTARAARPVTDTRRPTAVARVMTDLRVAPTARIGMQFALDRGHGRRPLPVRSSVAGAAFGVLVVVAVLVFGASLQHVIDTPAAYGWTWDLVASDTAAQQEAVACDVVGTRLTELTAVADAISVCNVEVQVDGRPVQGWGFTDLKGHIEPAIVDGRAPAAVDEVALGAQTLTAIGAGVGDEVPIVGSGGRHRYRVVGSVALPSLSDPQPLADGAVFTGGGLKRLDDASNPGSWTLMVRLATDVDGDRARQQLASVARRDSPAYGPTLPAEIERVQQIDGLPVALAAFVAVVALVAVGFALVSAARRRRRDLAVLKTLGFQRRQVRTTVAWHATTVAVIGLVVGIPLGLVVGRLAWRTVADELGISAAPTWPVVAVTLLVPAVLVAVNLVAAIPARRAARTRPAVVLRSE